MTVQVELGDLPIDAPELVLAERLAEYSDILERRLAAEAEAALHAAGLKRATMRAVARPGKVGDLRIEGMPTSGMGGLCKALCGRRGK